MADDTNEIGKDFGFDFKLDPKSYQEQGLDILPTIHEGKSSGENYDSRKERNKAIKEKNAKKEEDEGKMCNEQIIQKEKLRFRETAETMMQVFVVKYHKNNDVTIFWFNNKDCQLIFRDSTELLLSKNHVTYVNKVGNRKYFNK